MPVDSLEEFYSDLFVMTNFGYRQNQVEAYYRNNPGYSDKVDYQFLNYIKKQQTKSHWQSVTV